jgi:hypothetical protein
MSSEAPTVWTDTPPTDAEVLRHHPELDDQICREVYRPDLAPLLLP